MICGGVILNIQKLIEDYAAWLKSEITFDKIGEYFEITTPYLDNANDYIQIYVKQDGNGVFFSDDCATIHGLKMHGIQINSNRKLYLEKILGQYDVKLKGDEMVTRAAENNFAQKKHLFIQAVLRIGDMFSDPQSKESSFFLDDIQDFFAEQEIYYSENVQFTGISGFSHNYDFLLQRSKTKPERLCQAVNNPNNSSMGNILFAWNDTKPARKNESQLIVILNDRNYMAKGIEDAFLNYEAKVVRWSERNRESIISLLSTY